MTRCESYYPFKCEECAQKEDEALVGSPGGPTFEEVKTSLLQSLGAIAKDTCEHCGCTGGVSKVHSMTAYAIPAKTVWDVLLEREPVNPNADLQLCVDCAGDYRDFWQGQWDEYYSSLL